MKHRANSRWGVGKGFLQLVHQLPFRFPMRMLVGEVEVGRADKENRSTHFS
ncbi:MAG: hypothetical protein IIW09_00295 [Acetobacter sp.]|nr:hypothetical protein [Acetobacter sp.]